MVKAKKGKKSWFKIIAPEIFNNVELGETPAYAPEMVIGRTVELTMPFINGDFSKNHILIKFQIVDVSGDTAKTIIKEYSLTREYVRSLPRRRTSKVEVIKDVEFKDGKKARVKTVVITQHRAHYKQKKDILKKVEELVESYSKEYEFDKFILDCINGIVQQKMKPVLHKIYPIRTVEIRKVELKQ